MSSQGGCQSTMECAVVGFNGVIWLHCHRSLLHTGIGIHTLLHVRLFVSHPSAMNFKIFESFVFLLVVQRECIASSTALLFFYEFLPCQVWWICQT
jgi:hypothetical protein